MYSDTIFKHYVNYILANFALERDSSASAIGNRQAAGSADDPALAMSKGLGGNGSGAILRPPRYTSASEIACAACGVGGNGPVGSTATIAEQALAHAMIAADLLDGWSAGQSSRDRK